MMPADSLGRMGAVREARDQERTRANAGVWTFLGLSMAQTRTGPRRDPYWESGCHPDVVERVWDRLGPALPAGCRARLGDRPVLAHPATGAVLAFAYGTSYVLRVAAADRPLAEELGLGTTMRWSSGRTTDLAAGLGEGWYFGRWAGEEPAWCRRAYDESG